jgi:hypothetical protein
LVVSERDPGGDRLDQEQAEAARTAMRRALWRLNVLEYLILFLALLLALGGGALVAWVLSNATPLSFRHVWIPAALLLFVVPGWMAYLRELRRGRETGGPDNNSEPESPNG